MEHLFSYGTLQQVEVQLENFGRRLEGSIDILQKFIVNEVEIKEAKVVELSKKTHHPILSFTGDLNDEVNGMVFEITEEELMRADAYEVNAYKRVQLNLKSGIPAWVYVEK